MEAQPEHQKQLQALIVERDLLNQEALWLWNELKEQKEAAAVLAKELASANKRIADLLQQIGSQPSLDQEIAPVEAQPEYEPILDVQLPEAVLKTLESAKKAAADLAEFPTYGGLLFDLAGHVANLNKCLRDEPKYKAGYRLGTLLEALVTDLWKNPALLESTALQTMNCSLEMMEALLLSKPQTHRAGRVFIIEPSVEKVFLIRQAMSLLEVDAQHHLDPSSASGALEEADLVIISDSKVSGLVSRENPPVLFLGDHPEANGSDVLCWPPLLTELALLSQLKIQAKWLGRSLF